jgi:hypothetical protein
MFIILPATTSNASSRDARLNHTADHTDRKLSFHRLPDGDWVSPVPTVPYRAKP